MSPAPKVTIAMPVYNGGDYFELALRSALAQTYTNIEIIVVDDGSTDKGASLAVAERYASLHPGKVRCLAQPNTGVAGALNRVVAEMSGDLFRRLSHDDLFLPDKTERELEFLLKLRSTEAVVYSDWDCIDSAGAFLFEIRRDPRKLRACHLQPVLDGAVNGCTVMIPRKILPSDPFPVACRHTQDYRLWWRLIRRYGFFHLPRVTVRQRVHAEQGSRDPQALVEGDELWIDILDDVSGTERLNLHGSSFQFYSGMRAWLQPTPYHRAERHAAELARCFAQAPTVAVCATVAGPADASALAAVATAGRPVLAIVDDPALEACLRDASDRICLLLAPEALGRETALIEAETEYVLFVQAGACPDPAVVELWARVASAQGWPVSALARDSAEETGAEVDLTQARAVMLNRFAAPRLLNPERPGGRRCFAGPRVCGPLRCLIPAHGGWAPLARLGDRLHHSRMAKLVRPS